VRRNRKPARTYLSSLLVAIAMAVPAAAQTSDGSNVRIDNFGRVNANYYRGAQPKGRDYADLAAFGVKTLVNLAGDDAEADEPLMAARAGLKYLQIPMSTHEPPTAAQLTRFLEFVNDPANQPVYVHCVGGRHRTGVMTAAYRMTKDAWSSEQAFKEMKQYKFGADFLHPEFKAFVYGYQAATASTVAATKAGS
jgi:protein tyrosine/serine phosphatase